MPKKRQDYLDMAKGIGIYFVVLGHIEYLEKDTLRWIYSFHMPLFFIIGGILAYIKRNQELTLGHVLKKRACGTLIPYISFSLILITMRVFEYFLQPELITKRELFKQCIDSITGYGLHTLWFLPAYFLSGMLFWGIRYFLREGPHLELKIGLSIFILTSISLGIIYAFSLDQYSVMEKSLLWHMGMNFLIVLLRTLVVLPFFWIGWCYAKQKGFHEKKGRLLVTGILFLILGFLLSRYGLTLDLHYLYIRPLHYIVAAITCIGLLNLLQVLPVSRICSYLGRNSLIVMCTHGPMYVLYYVSLGMFFVRKLIPMTDSILYGVIALVVCMVEIPIIWIFNHYLRHLLGRKL